VIGDNYFCRSTEGGVTPVPDQTGRGEAVTFQYALAIASVSTVCVR